MARGARSGRLAAPLLYQSADGSLAVELTSRARAQIVRQCRVAADRETGGILIGAYTTDLRRAVVSSASGPGRGSTATRSRFFRAVGRLQDQLDRLWTHRLGYYVGEWHWHFHGSPAPSSIDRRQMEDLSRDPAYNCPEPILIVVGGEPKYEWSAVVEVRTRSGLLVPLLRVERGGSADGASRSESVVSRSPR